MMHPPVPDNCGEVLGAPSFEFLTETQTTPYSRTQEEISVLVESLLSDPSLRYIDSMTNPEIGGYSVFKVDSKDPRSDVGKTLEETIFSKESGYEAGFIESNFAPYDNNSTFMILVDPTDQDDQKAVGALRIIDCTKGSSETVSMFKEFYPDKSLPPELTVQEGEDLWDILTIVMEPEYRNGVNSAWLYHALYRFSEESNVRKCIANITPREVRNLREFIGMPFIEIPGVDEVVDVVDGKESVYGFYTLDSTTLLPSISARIIEIEQSLIDGTTEMKEVDELLVKVARVFLFGYSD